jgi:hypothetical protein
MKTNSKIITRISLAVFASTLFVTAPVYAVQGTGDNRGGLPETEKTKTVSQQSVLCKNFDTIVSKTTTEISKRGSSSNTEWQKHAGNIQTKRAEWAAKVAAARVEAAKKRDANFAKLDALATTDAQKTAVATYKEKVLAAVAARQAAYDANWDAYFKGVDALLASQKTDTSGDVNAFKASVTAAIEKAKASCASGASGETVKKQLAADLKAARESFKGQRTGDKTSIKSQLEALKNTRKDANKKASETFKTSLQAARTDLKSAFPSTDDNV